MSMITAFVVVPGESNGNGLTELGMDQVGKTADLLEGIPFSVAAHSGTLVAMATLDTIVAARSGVPRRIASHGHPHLGMEWLFKEYSQLTQASLDQTRSKIEGRKPHNCPVQRWLDLCTPMALAKGAFQAAMRELLGEAQRIVGPDDTNILIISCRPIAALAALRPKEFSCPDDGDIIKYTYQGSGENMSLVASEIMVISAK